MKTFDKYFYPVVCIVAFVLLACGWCIRGKITSASAIDPAYVAALRVECDNLAAENAELRDILTDLVKNRQKR